MAGGGTVRHDAWTSGELQVIYDLVNELDWFGRARLLLPRRTDNAIRTKMSLLRMETGIIPGLIGQRAKSTASVEIERATIGSAKLLRAIRELEAA